MGELGIRATFLNSSLDAAERSRRVAPAQGRGIRAPVRRARRDRRVRRAAAGCARAQARRRRRGALHQRMGTRFSPRLPQPRGPQAAIQGHPGAGADRHRDAARQERYRGTARARASARRPRLVLSFQSAPVRREERAGGRRARHDPETRARAPRRVGHRLLPLAQGGRGDGGVPRGAGRARGGLSRRHDARGARRAPRRSSIATISTSCAPRSPSAWGSTNRTCAS